MPHRTTPITSKESVAAFFLDKKGSYTLSNKPDEDLYVRFLLINSVTVHGKIVHAHPEYVDFVECTPDHDGLGENTGPWRLASLPYTSIALYWVYDAFHP